MTNQIPLRKCHCGKHSHAQPCTASPIVLTNHIGNGITNCSPITLVINITNCSPITLAITITNRSPITLPIAYESYYESNYKSYYQPHYQSLKNHLYAYQFSLPTSRRSNIHISCYFIWISTTSYV